MPLFQIGNYLILINIEIKMKPNTLIILILWYQSQFKTSESAKKYQEKNKIATSPKASILYHHLLEESNVCPQLQPLNRNIPDVDLDGTLAVVSTGGLLAEMDGVAHNSRVALVQL